MISLNKQFNFSNIQILFVANTNKWQNLNPRSNRIKQNIRHTSESEFLSSSAVSEWVGGKWGWSCQILGEVEMGKKVCPNTSTEQYWKGSHMGGTGMGEEKLAPPHSIPF